MKTLFKTRLVVNWWSQGAWYYYKNENWILLSVGKLQVCMTREEN